jgi:hypothetical protein
VTNPEDLGKEMQRVLQGYAREAALAIEQAKKDASRKLVKDIKQDSPIKTGSYKKGWKTKKSGRQPATTYTVYNKTDYQLTHLLEHGHAKRGGGRVSGIPHIGKNAERNIDLYLKDVEKALQ